MKVRSSSAFLVLFSCILLLSELHWHCSANGNDAFFNVNDVCSITDEYRFDCFPDLGADEQKCEARGCCWRLPTKHMEHDFPLKSVNDSDFNVEIDTPYCFYPTNVGGYKVVEIKDTTLGQEVTLQLQGKGPGPYGNNYETIVVDVNFETQGRLHVRIRDPNNTRYTVPIPTPSIKKKSSLQDYVISYDQFPFGFQVRRKSNQKVIFNSSVGAFIFSSQFLQLSAMLPSSNIYGLGEHNLGLKLSTKWTRLTLFARDIDTPAGGVNLYGVHPFYLNIEDESNAHGVLLLNSNAMDIILQPAPAITYRTIGGILDFYFFLGPSPDEVIRQYTNVIGKPIMPPYWSLGFHLCRWGYKNISRMETVVRRVRDNKIPQDVQWNDIEYMRDHLDFTLDNDNFAGLYSFVEKLKSEGLHYVMIMDPGISNTQDNYPAYTRGLELNTFVKDSGGTQPIVGKVWPGNTVFPDFFNPNASIYWQEQVEKFHEQLNFDGMWIDMNEPSNFVVGSTTGCPESSLEDPPYTPHILGGTLRSKTLCMTAKHYSGTHYDLHSLYGYSEGVVTMNALEKIRKKRSLVIGRSTFVGSGAHQGHWLGDNHSEWPDLYASIPGILNFGLFGIPLVGADICGFNGNTNEELCSRWMQLGAFYPFSRNHNTINAIPQDPAAFGEQLLTASRNALLARYMLLPYLYTLFYLAHQTGIPVARPLFQRFPEDKNTWGIDKQFLWGEALLITPVLEQGATSVHGYFPKGVWYSVLTEGKVVSSGGYFDLQASFEYPNLHLLGGYVIPTQIPGLTTTESRKNPFGAFVAPLSNGTARGVLYMDDGETIDAEVSGPNTLGIYEFQQNTLIYTAHAMQTAYDPGVTWDSLIAFGVSTKPEQVLVNGNPTSSYIFDQDNQKLTISNMKLSLLKTNQIQWT